MCYLLVPIGDNFVRPEFNLIWLVIFYIILRHFNDRHPFFTWTIAVLPSIYVCYGTIVRVNIIDKNKAWDSVIVEDYFIHALASWIAAIITDGAYAISLFTVLLQQRPHIQHQTWKRTLLEATGLLASLLTMVKFGFDVYFNFHHLTSDNWLYIYFFGAVVAKISKILIQGML